MVDSIRELYRYRALIAVLVSRDLKARYRGSVLGFMWSMLNPFLMMLVYWLVFSIYLRNGMENYHVYLFCGLLPWVWFSASLLEGCSSIISGANLVKKVMFPAEILPLVVVISNLIHFFFGLPILAGFLVIYRISPGPQSARIPSDRYGAISLHVRTRPRPFSLVCSPSRYPANSDKRCDSMVFYESDRLQSFRPEPGIQTPTSDHHHEFKSDEAHHGILSSCISAAYARPGCGCF